MKSLLVRNNSDRPINILIEPWLDSCVVDPGEKVIVSCETSFDELDVSVDCEGDLTFESEGDYRVFNNGVELIPLRKLRAEMPETDFDSLIGSLPIVRMLFGLGR